MASKELNVKIKQRYDTSSNWTTNNPVLLAGELGIESDTKLMKVGDGITAWTSLSYIVKTGVIDSDVNIWDLNAGTYIIKPKENNGSLKIYYDYFYRDFYFKVKTGIINITKPLSFNGFVKYYFANVLLEEYYYIDISEAPIAQALIQGKCSTEDNTFGVTLIDGSSPIAKISDIPKKVSELNNDLEFVQESKLGDYVTVEELNGKGYLTSIPSYYITEDELNAKGYLTRIPMSTEESISKAYARVIEENTEAGMLDWPSAQRGYICVRTDLRKTFILSDAPASERSNWVELQAPVPLSYLTSVEMEGRSVVTRKYLVNPPEGTPNIQGSIVFTVINSLTNSSDTDPLSASQGKKLKEMIDDLSNSSGGSKIIWREWK